MSELEKIFVDPTVKALIFDCDGTLVDTMKLHMEAWKAALGKYGLVYDNEFFFSKKGMSETEIMIDYGKHFDQDVDAIRVVEAKHNYFKANVHLIKPIDIVVDVASEYKGRFPMSVVSGGTKENVVASLNNIGMDNYFDFIITADDNLKSKPAPDKFLEAARLMNVDPKYCQVFEDAKLGIEAAISAGMRVVDVVPYIKR